MDIFAFDLPFCVQSSLRQYADDTVLFRAIRHDTDLVVLQSDLHNIVTWCNLNRMSLNVKKCKLMTITRSKSPPRPLYTIGSDTLEIVNNYKYLGVTITRYSDLSWKQHIRVNNIVSKTTTLFGFIRRIIKCRDPGTIVKLYCSLPLFGVLVS